MITSDACATPGCGHSKQQHGPNGCHYIGVRDYVWGCSCTAYLPPRPVPEEDHGNRGWEATATGWRCTECHHEVVGPIDVTIDAAHRCATVPAPHAEAEAAWAPSRETLDDLMWIGDAYVRGDELTSQQIDRFHTNADMRTVRWLVRTVYGMTAHRDSLQRQLDDLRGRGDRG